MSLVTLALGLILLVAGAQGVVRGSTVLAQRFNIPPFVIGLTVVGFATSTPEFAASVGAAVAEFPDIAVGTVIGSNTANVLLILGLTAIIHPLTVDRRTLRRDGIVMLLATAIVFALMVGGAIGRPVGWIMLAAFAIYLLFVLGTERQPTARLNPVLATRVELVGRKPGHPVLAALLALAGLAALVVGATWLIEGAAALAFDRGVPLSVIGLTIIAITTSLPELVTSITAAARGQAALALGNIVGSNIFNVMGILATVGVVHPLTFPAELAGLDVYVMIAAGVVLFVFAATELKITRREGLIMLAGYIAYLGFRL